MDGAQSVVAGYGIGSRYPSYTNAVARRAGDATHSDLVPEKRIPCYVIQSTQGERHGEDNAGALHAHSDHGRQYASGDFRDLLTNYGIATSMSRRSNCWDNACSETLESRAAARAALRDTTPRQGRNLCLAAPVQPVPTTFHLELRQSGTVRETLACRSAQASPLMTTGYRVRNSGARSDVPFRGDSVTQCRAARMSLNRSLLPVTLSRCG